MRYENKQNLIPSEVRVRIEKIFEKNKNRMGFRTLEELTNNDISLSFMTKTRLDEEINVSVFFEDGEVSMKINHNNLKHPLVLRYIEEIIEEAVTATQTL